MANQNLSNAKMVKNDMFYTQYHDFEIEVYAYLEYDPVVFRVSTDVTNCQMLCKTHNRAKGNR